MRTQFDFDREWRMFVDGTFQEADGGERLDVEDPATGTAFATAPDGTAADVDAAVDAANRTTDEWGWTDASDRAGMLFEVANRIEAHREEMVALETRENGKPLDQSENDVVAAAETFRFYAGGADKFYSDTVEHSPEQVRQKVFEPYGVVGIVIPWNWPPMHTADFVAVALATGNTVVLKPAPETPLSSIRIAELAADVLPDGVLNVVTGHDDEIGDHVSSHETPRVLSFTGSTAVGKRVAGRAGESIAQAALELGGNGPNVVTADVDIEQAARVGAVGSFTHQGQVCISINRHIVHEEVHDEYVDRLVEHAESLTVGNPAEEGVDFGPIVNESQRDDLLGYVEQTVEQGATLETGGEAEELFFEPTVLSGATNEMAAACNEHFGPVAPVIEVPSAEAAVEVANDTEYGLAAAVQCRDLDRARDLADQVESGMVHINDHPIQDEPNAPFGGMKESGLGRYNGEWVMDELVEPKWISVQHEDRDYDLLE